MVTRVPLGICHLSSYLKSNGHDVKVFDTTFIKCGNVQNDEELRAASLQVRNPDFKQYELIEKESDAHAEFEKEVESFKPDVIAMSVVDPNYNFGVELLKRVKNKHKDIKTIVGGQTATYAPDEVIAEDSIDIVCIGEGEEAMTELCNNMQYGKDIKSIKNLWVKEDGNIFKNPPRPLLNVNDILFPDWDIFDHRHLFRPLGGKMYKMGIFYMSRGCLFRCKYCSNNAQAKIYTNRENYYRIKKPDVIVKEIANYKEKYDLEFVFFIDDLFPLHKPDIMDEFSRLYREHVNLPFTISLYPELVREEQFAKVVEAGCRNISVGVESGDPKIRKEVLGRIYKNDQVINVISLSHKYNIRSSTFNMIGLPQEDRSSIFKTIELNKKARPTSATLTFFHPYRGTDLRDLCIREKYFDPTNEKEYETIYRIESYLSLPQISNRTLHGLFKTFQLYIKLPKIFYGLIRIAEGEKPLANIIFKILKIIFYKFTEKESKWDFTKTGKDSKSITSFKELR